MPTRAALSCPLIKIPNSDREDGITGKLHGFIDVTCNGETEWRFVPCVIYNAKAVWVNVPTCEGWSEG